MLWPRTDFFDPVGVGSSRRRQHELVRHRSEVCTAAKRGRELGETTRRSPLLRAREPDPARTGRAKRSRHIRGDGQGAFAGVPTTARPAAKMCRRRRRAVRENHDSALPAVFDVQHSLRSDPHGARAIPAASYSSSVVNATPSDGSSTASPDPWTRCSQSPAPDRRNTSTERRFCETSTYSRSAGIC